MDGNGYTGTENAFDIYDPSNGYCGTFNFGGYPLWATWPAELFGGCDPARGMTYYGIGAKGNNACLYTLGKWAGGPWLKFMMRKWGATEPGWLVASLKDTNQYLPQCDITRLVGHLGSNTPVMMDPHPNGDFDIYGVKVPPYAMSARIYFQGVISQSNPLVPIEASNGVYSN